MLHLSNQLGFFFRAPRVTRAFTLLSVAENVKFNLSFNNQLIQMSPYVEEDADQLFRIIDQNRRYLGAWLPWVDQTRSTKHSVDFIREMKSQQEKGTALVCGIFRGHSLLGTTSLININSKKSCAELGYWIVEQEQGKQIVTHTSLQMLAHGFEGINLDSIGIRCVSKNKPSAAIIHKLFPCTESAVEQQWVNGASALTNVVTGSITQQQWRERQSFLAQQDDSSSFSRNTGIEGHNETPF
jgi:ribosomal-protein-serine acetyltransferase